MNREQLQQSLRRIRSYQPSFGVWVDELKDDINHYRAFYDLSFPNCDFQYGYIRAMDEQLFVQRFSPICPQGTKGTVLLLHGYLDHAGSLSKTIRFLVECGYVVVCFDLLGHGLSSGERVTISAFTDYTDSLAVVCTEVLDSEGPIHLVAHSTGAAIGLEYLEKNRAKFDKIVLISPLFRPHLWQLSRIGLWFGKPYLRQFKRIFTRNSADKSYLTFTRLDPLQEKVLPLDWLDALEKAIKQKQGQKKSEISFLMIQGDHDRTVDTTYGLRWAMDHYPQSSFILMKDGRHQLLNEEPIIRSQTLSIIEKYLERP